MTPNTSLGEWYLWEKKTPDRDAYLARLQVFDLATSPPGSSQGRRFSNSAGETNT